MKFLKRFNKSTDDGIDFQWGERYIRADEVIQDVGGKYWRDNHDGTITEFTVPANKIKSTITFFAMRKLDFTQVSNDTVKFKRESDASNAAQMINENEFSKSRNIKAEVDGLNVRIITDNEVFESTYVPGGSI